MPDLTEIEKLAREAKERAEKATPGPWHEYDELDWSEDTIKFIAASRTDVPALADAVLQLVQRVRELENGQE